MLKHWTAAHRRIDYPIRECPVWRKATGGSGSLSDLSRIGQLQTLSITVQSSCKRSLPSCAASSALGHRICAANRCISHFGPRASTIARYLRCVHPRLEHNQQGRGSMKLELHYLRFVACAVGSVLAVLATSLQAQQVPIPVTAAEVPGP